MSCNALIFNIILLKTLFSAELYASCHVNKETVCRTSPQMSLIQELARSEKVYQKAALQDSVFKELQLNSLQRAEEIQKDPIFQEIMTELQSNPLNTAINLIPETEGNQFDANFNEASLYIFVSFSLGEKALLNLAHDAKKFGATLVLRGFKDGSYLKTVQALHKIILKTGQGVLIDPELYTLFNISAVPIFILAKPFQLRPEIRTQTPIHDKLQGHVSTRYALEIFAKQGDLNNEAQSLLNRGGVK